jgi:hypothetical protein
VWATHSANRLWWRRQQGGAPMQKANGRSESKGRTWERARMHDDSRKRQGLGMDCSYRARQAWIRAPRAVLSQIPVALFRLGQQKFTTLPTTGYDQGVHTPTSSNFMQRQHHAESLKKEPSPAMASPTRPHFSFVLHTVSFDSARLQRFPSPIVELPISIYESS